MPNLNQELNDEFQSAQLSMAAYANLTPGMSEADYIQALKNVGFTEQYATAFAARYAVESVTQGQFTDHGLFAVVFKDNTKTTQDKIRSIRGMTNLGDVPDILNIALIGSLNLSPQYGVLKDYIDSLSVSGGVLAGQTFAVTGHSLGGFLAQGLAADTSFNPDPNDPNTPFNTRISQAFTYNAPGFGGLFSDILNALGGTNPFVPTVPPGTVTNLVASNGLSPIGSQGQHIGEEQDLFIEAGTLLHNHEVQTLTDSLAEYDLFGRIAANVTIPTITHILNAAAAIPNESLENTFTALQRLFLNQNVAIRTDDRNTLYTQINALETRTVDGQHE